ncbi:coiled-coil domain-containing protein 93-like [Saccoglossus kowalevskii]
MKCAHRLEPHQIQGLDFIHIYPTVQWLVKKAIETREELGDYNRAFSVSQFNKHHSTPQDIEFEKQKSECFGSIRGVKDCYKPRRRYRRSHELKSHQEELRVQSTLLEYGRKLGHLQSAKAQKADETDGTKKAISDAMDKGDDLANWMADEKRIKDLMKGMSISEDVSGH